MASDDTKRPAKVPPWQKPGESGAAQDSPAGVPEEFAPTVVNEEQAEVAEWRASLRPRLGSKAPSSTADESPVVDVVPERPSRPTETHIHVGHRPLLKKPATRQSLPWRTWALLALTVGAAVYVFFLSGESGKEKPPQKAKHTASVNVSDKPAVTKSSTKDTVAGAKQDSDEHSVGVQDERIVGKSQAELERGAVEAWVNGKLFDALIYYKALAKQLPNDPSYSFMVQKLRADLARSCKAGEDPC